MRTASRQREIQERLRALSLFRGLRSKELAHIAQLVEKSKLPAGWRLTKQGQAGFDAFILLEGTAGVEIDGIQVATLGPGDTVGEMALLDGAPRSATVVAQTDVEVLFLTPATMEALVAMPSVARAVIRSLAGRLRSIEGAPEHW
jgi:CRP/FNR family transcriptional regulator, cyclic AMP receptor protein